MYFRVKKKNFMQLKRRTGFKTKKIRREQYQKLQKTMTAEVSNEKCSVKNVIIYSDSLQYCWLNHNLGKLSVLLVWSFSRYLWWKKKIQREGDYGMGMKVVLTNVCGVGSERWIINDDIIWIFSEEESAVDTFVLWKEVEGRVIKCSESVILNWLFSIRNEVDGSTFSAIWGMNCGSLVTEFFCISGGFGRVIRTLKCFSLTFVKFGVT